jgi:hypothetical protein
MAQSAPPVGLRPSMPVDRIFPTLTPARISPLACHASVRSIQQGEVLEAGDRPRHQRRRGGWFDALRRGVPRPRIPHAEGLSLSLHRPRSRPRRPDALGLVPHHCGGRARCSAAARWFCASRPMPQLRPSTIRPEAIPGPGLVGPAGWPRGCRVRRLGGVDALRMRPGGGRIKLAH